MSDTSHETEFKKKERAGHRTTAATAFRGAVPEPDETPDVSVIVPCYNVEKYIDQCLDTIAQNDRVKLEVIVVNDGSKDSTLDHIRAFCDKDPRFHVVDKPNGGYGMGVNVGFENAHGTYVAIVEPDDYLKPHFYDDVVDYARTFDELPDIVKTPYIRITLPGTPKEHPYNCAYYRRVHPAKQPFTIHDAPRLLHHHPSIWSAIYLRSFINEKNIRMMEVPGAGWVDNPFLVETLCQARSIAVLDEPYYCYREDLPGSSSMLKSTDLAFERWNDMADVLDDLGIDDPEVRRAHNIRGFAYVAGILEEGDISGTKTEELMNKMYARMDPDLVLTSQFVPNEFKGIFVRARNLKDATWDPWLYRRSLIEEFFYSWRTNGFLFAASRITLYIGRKFNVHRHDPTKTKSAGI